MSATDYADILAHLQRPKSTVITPWMLQEIMNPCEPPDDPYWPAPSSSRHFYNLARRLGHRQMILCLATGVQMAIGLWNEWVADRPDFEADLAMAPLHAALFAERWALGEELFAPSYATAAERALVAMREEEFPGATTNWRGHYVIDRERASAAAFHVVECAVGIAKANETSRWSGPGDSFIEAVTRAYGRVGRRKFLAVWWARCRSRLAFSGAMTAEIE